VQKKNDTLSCSTGHSGAMISPVAMLNWSLRCALSILAVGAMTNLQAQQVAITLDPITLESEIGANPDFDVASLWRRLKIPADLDTVYAKVGATPPASAKTPFARCSNACRAQLTRADLDGDGRNEAILAIYLESGVSRLLVFKGNPAPAGLIEWRFLGHADHDALGQYDPEYRVSFMGAHRYLVVLAPVTQAAEIWIRYERWYEVGPTSMREVLSLPAEALECRDQRSLCRAFGSTVVAARNGTRGEELVASFTARYWGDRHLVDESLSDQILLFGRSMRAVFVRPLKSLERYELAPLDSEIASWELETFRLEGLTCEDFLGDNTDNLSRIVSDRESAARSWLARYVEGCSPSKERTEFLELLKK
jgi:hypothetical protein